VEEEDRKEWVEGPGNQNPKIVERLIPKKRGSITNNKYIPLGDNPVKKLREPEKETATFR